MDMEVLFIKIMKRIFFVFFFLVVVYYYVFCVL